MSKEQSSLSKHQTVWATQPLGYMSFDLAIIAETLLSMFPCKEVLVFHKQTNLYKELEDKYGPVSLHWQICKIPICQTL